jgi:hypothetical protein
MTWYCLQTLKAKDILQFMKSVTVSLYPFYGNDSTARQVSEAPLKPALTCSIAQGVLCDG